MIFHLSINAHDPAKVAAALAELLGADDIAAPSPPFPPGARMVCRFNERGSMVEVAPIGQAFVPGPDGEVQFAPSETADGSSFHGLFMAAVSEDRVHEIAAAAGWTSALTDAGPFKVINVWLEGRQLIELTTPELVGDYLALYGPENREHLDGQLREVEQTSGPSSNRPPRHSRSRSFAGAPGGRSPGRRRSGGGRGRRPAPGTARCC